MKSASGPASTKLYIYIYRAHTSSLVDLPSKIHNNVQCFLSYKGAVSCPLQHISLGGRPANIALKPVLANSPQKPSGRQDWNLKLRWESIISQSIIPPGGRAKLRIGSLSGSHLLGKERSSSHHQNDLGRFCFKMVRYPLGLIVWEWQFLPSHGRSRRVGDWDPRESEIGGIETHGSLEVLRPSVSRPNSPFFSFLQSWS